MHRLRCLIHLHWLGSDQVSALDFVLLLLNNDLLLGDVIAAYRAPSTAN